MTKKSDLIAPWLLICFMAGLFTWAYNSSSPDESNSWVINEIVWWTIAILWVGVLAGMVIIALSYWGAVADWLRQFQTRREQSKNEEVQRQVREFKALIDRLGEGEVLSREVLQSTVLQAAALADVVIELHNRALGLPTRRWSRGSGGFSNFL